MTKENTETTKGGIQVIARSAAILRALKDQPNGMSLGQIATATSLPRSTVQRIVAALQTERFIISVANGGGLKLGPELGALAEATHYNIVEQCRIFLSELSQATGETADLSVLRGNKMIFLDQVPGTQRLRAISSVGDVFPVTTTANGRACLAMLPREDAHKLAAQEWARQNVRPDVIKFDRMLNEVAENGIARDVDDHTDGISAVGFAFEDWTGNIHAISVPVPTSRFSRQSAEIETAIRATQKNIAKMMDRGNFN
ncbi:IclR family transcriptional regulator [Pacificibacter marinus]|uniref:IclR family transcriptional regulator n=1 Tax=Pacificibacter marinus TaxID=658057 RepID=UPI001C065367|nr:IclR family transcriptional regulator [Pacificibacter marinus]MBU2865804.1 IclR family transcriptional regulator [Pacificibacter marinus]